MDGFDVSHMTQEEFIAMTNEDGNLSEAPADRDEEETEETENVEAAEEEDGEEEPKEGDDSALDWSSIDARYKTAFDKAMNDSQKWMKDHSGLQSKLTKQSQQLKEFESTRTQLEEDSRQMREVRKMLSDHPNLIDLIDKELAKANNPLESVEIPDYLKEDPAFQYFQKAVNPYVQGLEKKLSQFEKRFSKFDEFERGQQESKHKEALDGQLKAAGEEIKSMLGRDASEDEITKVLQFMVENKFYGNGKAVAQMVFRDLEKQVSAEKHQAKMKEKAGKFAPRQKAGVSSRMKTDDSMDLEDAIKSSMAELRGH